MKYPQVYTVSRIIHFALTVVLCMYASISWADSRRIDQFVYDSAGNIVGRTSLIITQPPSISNITPEFINRGRTINVLSVGRDLLGVQVSTSNSELSISNVKSNNTSVTFNLSATPQATLGPSTIIFTTTLGNTTQSITVFERAPDVTTEPNPISIAANNQANTITVRIDPKASDQIYNLNITDTSFATLTSSSISIPANETTATFELTGLQLGNTELTISANDASFTFSSSFPVFVTEPLSGDVFESSLPVGIIVGTENPTGLIENALLPSASIGLVVGTENPSGTIESALLPSANIGLIVGTENPTGIIESALLPSANVGLIVGTENPTGTIESALLPSANVGLIVGTENPTGVIENALLPAPSIGALVGPHVISLQPTTVAPGSNGQLIISGVNLQNVDSVIVTPGDGITLGSFNVDASGTSISLPISVDASASLGIHTITVATPAGDVPVIEALSLEIIVQ